MNRQKNKIAWSFYNLSVRLCNKLSQQHSLFLNLLRCLWRWLSLLLLPTKSVRVLKVSLMRLPISLENKLNKWKVNQNRHHLNNKRCRWKCNWLRLRCRLLNNKPNNLLSLNNRRFRCRWNLRRLNKSTKHKRISLNSNWKISAICVKPRWT